MTTIGNTFGRLTVLSHAGSNKHGASLWNCQCSCGNTIVLSNNSLMYYTKSCGCLKNEATKERNLSKRNKYLNKWFGYLEIIGFEDMPREGEKCILAKCYCHGCNKLCLKPIRSLLRGVKSCGCKTSEMLSISLGGTGTPYENKTTQKVIREAQENRQFILKALQNAEYKCAITGKNTNSLEVHHILSMSTLIKSMNIDKNNWNNFTHLLFDMSNVIVLEKHLHRKFHRLYGNMTTPSQLAAFSIAEKLQLNIVDGH